MNLTSVLFPEEDGCTAGKTAAVYTVYSLRMINLQQGHVSQKMSIGWGRSPLKASQLHPSC
jgi:hypothetical protein